MREQELEFRSSRLMHLLYEYANEGTFKSAHQQQQNTWVILECTTTHIPSFVTLAHIELWIFDFVVISQSEQICK